jgi:phytoene desaturase
MKKTAIVIGSGFAGLSTAACLAKEGFEVTILEKNNQAGGRARQYEHEGFVFDMGPSWYWMPDVFERYFQLFGKTTSDFYNLVRLDPSYRVFFSDKKNVDLPASKESLFALFESLEKGSSKKLDVFLKESEYKYEVGINDLVYRPSRKLSEFLDLRMLKGLLQMDVFTSISKRVRKDFKNPKIIDILEFPVLFLGAKADKIPALYSLMNYADMVLGTWYPMNGMHEIVKAMVHIAEEQGVKIKLNTEVHKIEVENGKAKKVITFADQTFGHKGIIYKAANWVYNGCTEPSYFYRDPDGFVMHKKTLYNTASSNHMTESEFANLYNYKKIPSLPKERYLLVI